MALWPAATCVVPTLVDITSTLLPLRQPLPRGEPYLVLRVRVGASPALEVLRSALVAPVHKTVLRGLVDAVHGIPAQPNTLHTIPDGVHRSNSAMLTPLKERSYLIREA